MICGRFSRGVGLRLHRIALMLLPVLLTCVGLVYAQEWRVPTGLPALTDIASLPLLRTGTWLVGTDSHDVAGRNNDGFGGTYSYLYKDGDEYVLFEEDGPGCIYELRTIGFTGNLHLYLDGATEPQYTFSFPDIYLARTPPFVAPLVAPEATAHGSSWSYVPISFAKGCKLTTNEMGRNHFFNIFAHKYSDGTNVPSFDPQMDMKHASMVWSKSGERLEVDGEVKEERGTISLAQHETRAILEIEGAGAVKFLRLRLPDGATHLAGAVGLRAYWDGAPVPQVDSPASTFFGLGCPRALGILQGLPQRADRLAKGIEPGAVDTRSLVIGKDTDGWLYCYFPMPFWKSARIRLVNRSSEQPVQVEYAVGYSEHAYPASAGYFHARWRQENPVRFMEDYTVLDTRGHGHFVGCVLTMSAFQGRGHLEGDARLYIDDSRTPIVAGTGTEEYFNWGWYDMLPHDRVFSYPLHGYPVHAIDDQDDTVMYRFHIPDLVPYYRSFKFGLEHGGIGQVSGNYSGTAFFYQREEPLLVLTDELDVGSEDSERQHQYRNSSDLLSWSGSRVLPYEGSHQLDIPGDSPQHRIHTVKDDGRAWDRSCAFEVKIDPDNAGVKLRRRSAYDFGAFSKQVGEKRKARFTARQRVAVSVDGVEVGEWHISPRHARDTWLDTDFEIPKHATQGKERVTIALTNKLETPWDEYAYWIYSYRHSTD